jgi:hypothetical protein
VTTSAANLVFWTWPAAPPRFAVPGMTDVLDHYHILGSGDPHGPDSLVNLYAAMPSLHVAWAAWCAAAVVLATRSRWRHLAWLYPAATTFVVLATANHFVLDVAAGLAVMALGLLATRGIPVPGWHGIRARLGRRAAGATTRPDATGHLAGGVAPAAMGPGAAIRDRRPVIWWRWLARWCVRAVTAGRRRAYGAARFGRLGGRTGGDCGRAAAAVSGRRRGR